MGTAAGRHHGLSEAAIAENTAEEVGNGFRDSGPSVPDAPRPGPRVAAYFPLYTHVWSTQSRSLPQHSHELPLHSCPIPAQQRGRSGSAHPFCAHMRPPQHWSLFEHNLGRRSHGASPHGFCCGFFLAVPTPAGPTAARAAATAPNPRPTTERREGLAPTRRANRSNPPSSIVLPPAALELGVVPGWPACRPRAIAARLHDVWHYVKMRRSSPLASNVLSNAGCATAR
jgi:hypothetical protein